MKRTERQHLKRNEVQDFTRQAREILETKPREVTAAAAAVVVIVALAIGYYAWNQHVQGQAHDMLAQALIIESARVAPPVAPGGTAVVAPGSYPNEQARAEAAIAKLKAVADMYPSTDAGLFARYQQAAILVGTGHAADAIPLYNDVITRAGDSFYGQVSRLGVAEAHARGGQFDQAINDFKELAQRKDGPLPIDGILMHLGRTYVEAGKKNDAQQTFNRIVEEFPNSPYSGEARQQVESLKKS
jgi:predicted negative regulator of RcsB-dependent stress response